MPDTLGGAKRRAWIGFAIRRCEHRLIRQPSRFAANLDLVADFAEVWLGLRHASVDRVVAVSRRLARTQLVDLRCASIRRSVDDLPV